MKLVIKLIKFIKDWFIDLPLMMICIQALVTLLFVKDPLMQDNIRSATANYGLRLLICSLAADGLIRLCNKKSEEIDKVEVQN